MSLQICCWSGEQLPDNVTCGEGCDRFPGCLPTLELVRKRLCCVRCEAVRAVRLWP